MTPADFYSVPWVAQAIVQCAQQRYMTVRKDWGMCRHLVRADLAAAQFEVARGFKPWVPLDQEKDEKGNPRPFIEIHTPSGNGPFSLDYWVKQGAIEFIPEVSTVYDLDRTDVVVIDLDPKDPATPWAALVEATERVMTTLLATTDPEGVGYHKHYGTVPLTRAGFKDGVEVRDCKLRFSGNRSFHIYVQLERRVEFPKIRTALKTLLDPLAEETKGYLTYHNVRDRKDFILIDIGAVARHRCVRSLYSMHAKTGNVCIPVTRAGEFQKEWAKPEAVLAPIRQPVPVLAERF